MKYGLTQPLRNERGILSVNFLFSMVLILGLAGLMFVLCFSLSVASMTQYVTFSMARTYAAGHLSEGAQRELANKKYQELINNPVLKPLYNNGWFSVDPTPGIGDHTTIIPGFQEAAQGVNKFWGAGTTFTAKILSFTIPFFGSTAPDDETGEGFKTYLGSYLGRDPTTQECLNFTAARWSAIRALTVTGGASYSTGTPAGGYFPQTDDGC